MKLKKIKFYVSRKERKNVSQKLPKLAPQFFQFHIQNLHLQLLHRTIDNAQNDETAQIWNKTGYELT